MSAGDEMILRFRIVNEAATWAIGTKTSKELLAHLCFIISVWFRPYPQLVCSMGKMTTIAVITFTKLLPALTDLSFKQNHFDFLILESVLIFD